MFWIVASLAVGDGGLGIFLSGLLLLGGLGW